MRDIKRIPIFCDRFQEIWEKNCPDWRFGQIMSNVFGYYLAEHGIDLFFTEEDKMLFYFENYFSISNEKKSQKEKLKMCKDDNVWKVKKDFVLYNESTDRRIAVGEKVEISARDFDISGELVKIEEDYITLEVYGLKSSAEIAISHIETITII